MRKSALAGLCLCMFVLASRAPKAAALAADQSNQQHAINISNQSKLANLSFAKLAANDELSKQLILTYQPKAATPAPAPQPRQHTVTSGESLTTIAEAYETTWQRLFDKNTDIQDPNIISVGQTILIPDTAETLTPRVVPTPIVSTASSNRATAPRPAGSAGMQARGSAGGNGYYYGYCTYYAKLRRPDLPNNLGNADSWVARAAAQGIPTGSAPRAGAIGQQGMHVVYVESVNDDGTVTISEMNYKGWAVVNQRTVPASSFAYIY